jgi:hypothetical protein
VLSPSEKQIQQLCEQIASAKTPEELERVLTELRQALKEHVRQARMALRSEASAIALLDSDR